MSKAKLKKELLSQSKEQIVDIMLQLYDASKEAKAWLEFYLEPNCDAELEKYKKAIRSQFSVLTEACRPISKRAM